MFTLFQYKSINLKENAEWGSVTIYLVTITGIICMLAMMGVDYVYLVHRYILKK